MCEGNPLKMVPDSGSGNESRERNLKKSSVALPRPRLLLFFYFIIILLTSLYLIINFWAPSIPSVDIKSITTPAGNQSNITLPAAPFAKPEDRAKVNASNLTKAVTEPANITTVTTTTKNSTTEATKTETFLELVNGTKQLLKEDNKFIPKNGTLVFIQLQSRNPEIRLLSVAVLFGIVGASISGITSVLTRKLWNSKQVRSVRLMYVYFARPWVGAAVALVTYTALRAGLFNVANIATISEFGIAAISALVGLMTDEMTLKLRDVFRTLFGIQGLQVEPELKLSIEQTSIKEGDEILISATLTDLKPTGPLEAYFFVQDPDKVELIKKADNYFNDSGVAIAAIRGKTEGATLITVMARDTDLYDSQKITVTKAQKQQKAS